jgi:hypothetical protein
MKKITIRNESSGDVNVTLLNAIVVLVMTRDELLLPKRYLNTTSMTPGLTRDAADVEAPHAIEPLNTPSDTVIAAFDYASVMLAVV